jgi:hypothetical protein
LFDLMLRRFPGVFLPLTHSPTLPLMVESPGFFSPLPLRPSEIHSPIIVFRPPEVHQIRGSTDEGIVSPADGEMRIPGD